MEWWIALIVVAALGIAAAAAVGGMGEMAKDPVRDVYRQDLPHRPLGAADLDTVRFGITLRGYAMGQVDDLLDRVAAELSERDALIAELTGAEPLAELERRRARLAAPTVAPRSVDDLHDDLHDDHRSEDPADDQPDDRAVGQPVTDLAGPDHAVADGSDRP